jgi:hypothetical protein
MKIFTNMKQNYEKFQIRGAIKEIMRNYGLRTISIKNYYEYLKQPCPDALSGIHSVKYDIMNGYIIAYNFKANDKLRRCGDPIGTVANDTYREIYNVLESLAKNEHNIPSKVKRNIMVKVNR